MRNIKDRIADILLEARESKYAIMQNENIANNYCEANNIDMADFNIMMASKYPNKFKQWVNKDIEYGVDVKTELKNLKNTDVYKKLKSAIASKSYPKLDDAFEKDYGMSRYDAVYGKGKGDPDLLAASDLYYRYFIYACYPVIEFDSDLDEWWDSVEAFNFDGKIVKEIEDQTVLKDPIKVDRFLDIIVKGKAAELRTQDRAIKNKFVEKSDEAAASSTTGGFFGNVGGEPTVFNRAMNGQPVTLYEALEGHVLGYGYTRSMGYTHYSGVMEFVKKMKSARTKNNATVLRTTKRTTPSDASDLWAAVTKVFDQVEVDMNLPADKRLKEIEKAVNDIIGKSEFMVSITTATRFRYTKYGSKSTFHRAGEGFIIYLTGKTFEASMTVDDQCLLAFDK